MEEPKAKTDHDLIVEMHTTLSRVVSDLKALDTKVDDFNNNYARRQDIDPIIKDHEARLRRLEWFGGIAVGMLYLLQFLAKFLIK